MAVLDLLEQIFQDFSHAVGSYYYLIWRSSSRSFKEQYLMKHFSNVLKSLMSGSEARSFKYLFQQRTQFYQPYHVIGGCISSEHYVFFYLVQKAKISLAFLALEMFLYICQWYN